MLAAVRATHENLDLGVLDVLTRDAQGLPTVIGELNGEAAGAGGAGRAGSGGGDGGDGGGGGASTGPLSGWVVLATCNRLEIYLDTERFHDGMDLVVAAISRTSGLDAEHVSICLEVAMGSPVADHLYRVIAGLRSIVIGEAEVAGQVRTAFELARTAGYTTPLLNDLFQVGFRYAKKVATRTPVGAAGRSGVAIALDHAQKLLGPLDRLDVLVVGTGAYARLGVAELSRRGAGRIRVHSASGRAIEFAQRHGVSAVAADGLAQALREADLVLACSGRGTSLFPEHFRGVGPTLILDLALHSDLHPLVRHLRDVRIVDLSDLRIEVDEDAAPVLEAAQGIIADGVAHFRSRQEFRRVDPAMAALRRSLGEATDHEVARLRREDKDAAADDVERSIRRILAKVMHSPTLRARELAQQGNADEFVQAFHTIFGIDISEAGVAVAGQAGGGDSGGPASAVAATAASDGVGDVHGDERADRRWMRLDQSMPPASARDGRPTTAAPVTGDLTPADLGALADLARIGVARAADEGTAVCPLTAAQQQAFMTQVTRERS